MKTLITDLCSPIVVFEILTIMANLASQFLLLFEHLMF